MSEEQTTQAAVDETKAPAEQGAAETSAQDDVGLEALLAEFEGSKSETPATAKPDTKVEAATDTDAKTRLDALERQIYEQKFQQDIAPVVQHIKGAIPDGVLTDAEILDLLDAKAKRDPRLAAAWVDRSKNPQGWKKVQEGLARDFAKRFEKLPDKSATEDREAVTAAVRGASTKVPEGKTPDYHRMTPAQFQAEKDKMFG